MCNTCGYIIESRVRVNYKKSIFATKINAKREEVLIQHKREDLIQLCCPQGKVVNDITWSWVLSKLSLVVRR